MGKRIFGERKLSAFDALFEAQKIAFAPVVFQAACALCDLGVLREIEMSGKAGARAAEVAQNLDISRYGVETLLECGQSVGIVDCDDGDYRQRKYFLTKTGHFLLNDPMTRANMEFNQHVCYQAMAELKGSVRDQTPRGLELFGSHWDTLYEALPHLSPEVKERWDRFDHFYSEQAYPKALPFIFDQQTETLVDIGANNGDFAVFVANHDPGIYTYLVDLPGQLKIAMKNARANGLVERIGSWPADLLDPSSTLPKSADVYWMSQFLSCFSPDEITSILLKVRNVMGENSRILVLETCWDRQCHEASAFSLINTSPYFTCMANGKSKMYHSEELTEAIEMAGLEVRSVHDNLGICHSLFECVTRKGSQKIGG